MNYWINQCGICARYKRGTNSLEIKKLRREFVRDLACRVIFNVIGRSIGGLLGLDQHRVALEIAQLEPDELNMVDVVRQFAQKA